MTLAPSAIARAAMPPAMRIFSMISGGCTHGSVLFAGRSRPTYSGRAMCAGTVRIGVGMPGVRAVRSMRSRVRPQDRTVGIDRASAHARAAVRFAPCAVLDTINGEVSDHGLLIVSAPERQLTTGGIVTTPATQSPTTANSKGLALAAMIFAVGMTFIDQTIVAIASPDLQEELGLSRSGVQWVINGYLVALAAGFALGGRIADVIGSRRVVLVGIVGLRGFLGTVRCDADR